MKRVEYETELKALYTMAIKNNDVDLALELLERGRAADLDDMRGKEPTNSAQVKE